MASPVTLSTGILPGSPQSSPSHSGQHNEIARRLPVVAPGAPTGDATIDTANISDALSVLPQYGILFLTFGVFLVNATLSSSLDNFDVTGPGILKVDDGIGASTVYIFNFSGSNVKIKGVRFDGNKANSTGVTTGVHWADGASDCEAILCEFRNFEGAPVRANENDSGACARIHTKDCFFDGNNMWAVYYEGHCPNSQVTGNVIRNGFGIKINLSSIRCRVALNDIEDIVGIGIELWTDCHRSIVSLNIVKDAPDGAGPFGDLVGMVVSIAASDYCIVLGNYGENIGWAGFEFADSSYCKCIDNTVDGVEKDDDGGGITCSSQVDPCNHNIYQGNHILNVDYKAIHLHSGHSYSKVLDNYVLSCQAGIFLRNPGSTIDHCVVRGNTVHSCVEEGLEIESNVTETQVLDNDFRGNNTGTGTANVVDSGTQTEFRGNRGTHLGNEVFVPAYKFDATGNPSATAVVAGSTTNARRMQAWQFSNVADNDISAVLQPREFPRWWGGKTINIFMVWASAAGGAANHQVRWLTSIAAIDESDQIDEDWVTSGANPVSSHDANVAQDALQYSGPIGSASGGTNASPTCPALGSLTLLKILAYRVTGVVGTETGLVNLLGVLLRPVDP